MNGSRHVSHPADSTAAIETRLPAGRPPPDRRRSHRSWLTDPFEETGNVGIVLAQNVQHPLTRPLRTHEARGRQRLEMAGGAGLREGHVAGELGNAQPGLRQTLDDAESRRNTEAREAPLEDLTGIHCIGMHIIQRSLTASESVC